MCVLFSSISFSYVCIFDIGTLWIVVCMYMRTHIVFTLYIYIYIYKLSDLRHERNPALLSSESWSFNDGILISWLYEKTYTTGAPYFIFNKYPKQPRGGFKYYFFCSPVLGEDSYSIFFKWVETASWIRYINISTFGSSTDR